LGTWIIELTPTFFALVKLAGVCALTLKVECRLFERKNLQTFELVDNVFIVIMKQFRSSWIFCGVWVDQRIIPSGK
jgi:hypothetical protein